MRIFIAAVGLVAIGVVAGRFSVQPVVRAQDGCTNASFKGAYGFALNGFYYDQFGNQSVYAANGRTVADGAGALAGTETVSFDGAIQRNLTLAGTYTVNADCTGTWNFTDSKGAAVGNFDVVMTSGGKQVQLVEYDRGVIISGTATQQ